jgi:ferredoxin
MRSGIGWVGVAAFAAGGASFVFQGGGMMSHCGPCMTRCPVKASSLPAQTEPVEKRPTATDVTDVVDFAQVMVDPIPEPRRLPFVDFDSPTPVSTAVVPAVFVAPDGREVAPTPRAVAPTVIPLAKEGAPF